MRRKKQKFMHSAARPMELRRLLQRKLHIKIELCGRLSVLRLLHDGYVVQSKRSALSLAWYECFLYVRAENERLTAAVSR